MRSTRFILVCVASLVLITTSIRPAFAEIGHHYTVQRGDTMLTIATRFSISINELATANGLNWNAWLYTGQEMVIPGRTTMRVSRTAFIVDTRVLDELPALPVLPLEPTGQVVPFTYARVVQDDAPVYEHPSDVARGLPPKRRLGTGFIWVSVQDQTTWEGQDYYRINPGEYVAAEALSFYTPSTFQGVALATQPESPFAWILKPVQPSLTAGGELNPEAPVHQRYDLVQIYATEHLQDQVWYLIGPDQWINQVYVGKVTPSAPPEGVEPGSRWIEVNLFEQTLAAYEGEQMVYATLVSSGLRGWDTPPGLFQVWLKVKQGKMSGGYNRPDYYFLEDVPWTMYFNKDIGLHTAYWHDGFGYKRSHGCVNLPPLDAQWLFEWAPDEAWVWVHAD